MNNNSRPALPEDGKFPKLINFFDFDDLKSLCIYIVRYHYALEKLKAGGIGLDQTIIDTELHIVNTVRNICESYVRAGGGPGCMGDKNDPDRIFRNASGRETPGCVEVIAMMAAARGQVLGDDA